MEINKNVVKKAGIGLFSLTLGLGILGGGYYLTQNQVSAENNATQTQQVDTKAQVAEKQAQITSAVVGTDVFDKINTALKNKDVLDQTKLDELTYFMYQYAQSNYQFLGSDDSVSTADVGFEKLLELYKQSSVEPPFSYNSATGEVVMLRDVPKPQYYDKNIDKLQDKAEDAAKDVVDSKSKSVSTDLKTEVVE